MKHSAIFRLFSLLMAVLLLTGCSTPSGIISTSAPTGTEPAAAEPVPEKPTQDEMSQAQLQNALARAEYAMIAAKMALEPMENDFPFVGDIFLGDVYGKGQLQLVRSTQAGPQIYDANTGRSLTSPDISEGHSATVNLYTDKNNTFYLDFYDSNWMDQQEADGTYRLHDIHFHSLKIWQNSQWTTVMEWSTRGSWRIIDEFNNGYNVRYDDYVEISSSYQVDSKEVSKADYEAHVADIGLTEVTARPSDFTVSLYDAIYADSLLAALESRFSNDFGATALRQDIDRDGETETVIAVPGLIQPYSEYADRYTGILVADPQGDKLKLSAYATPGDVSLNDSMTVALQNHFLQLGDVSIYVPEDFDSLDFLSEDHRTAVFNGLYNYLISCGYTQAVFKTADIGDAPGLELLCLCQKDGQWRVKVFAFQNGIPVLLHNVVLTDSAVFLASQAEKQALLIYRQSMMSDPIDDKLYTTYAYSVCRFDQAGSYQEISGKEITFSDDLVDATKVSKFFELLNTYMIKLIVIADPYRFQGNQWLSPDDADHGTTPEEPEQDKAEEYTMGFVQIQDPTSWLNLREGPGTEYPCILIDENNPMSFVRQALGSPVTILETIETGDAENPVWVKVRIMYADRELVGYSSKRYIRVVEES